MESIISIAVNVLTPLAADLLGQKIFRSKNDFATDTEVSEMLQQVFGG